MLITDLVSLVSRSVFNRRSDVEFFFVSLDVFVDELWDVNVRPFVVLQDDKV